MKPLAAILVATVLLVSSVLAQPQKISLKSRKSFRKYPRSLKTTSEVSVPLQDYFNGTDLQWYGPIQLGTPPQNLTSIFDTGSGFLVVACTACTAALNCPAEVQKFNPNKSSTFTNDNIPLNAVYDTGVGVAPSDREEQNGIIGNDTLCVAGLCVSNLIFGVVNNQTAGLNANAFGGVLGMSPPAIGDNISNVIEFFPALAFMNKVHEKRFGFFLEPRKDDDGAGELTLGGIDETKLKSEIHFLPINSTLGTWLGNFSQITVNGRAINLVNEALFDTGTSNIVAPTTADALEVYSNISPNITLIDPAGAFGLPCDEIDRLPAVIDFTLAGKKFTVPSQELNVGPYPNQTGICQTLINSDVNDLSGGIWIIGASLLKYYYTVWDITNASTGVSQLGFASVAHSPPSAC